MKRAGSGRRGIYMFRRGDERGAAEEASPTRRRSGLYHFGMWVDDLAESEKKVLDAGGSYMTGRPTSANSYYEAKYKDPLGIVFDLTPYGPGSAPPRRWWPRTASRKPRRAEAAPRNPSGSSSSEPGRGGHLPGAGAGAGGRAGLPGRDAARRQFPRSGAARRHQSPGHARTVRPHRPLSADRAARDRGAGLSLLGSALATTSWSRRVRSHAHLKDDTRFPFVLQCERIKIVEEALQYGQGASRYRAAPSRPPSCRSSRMPKQGRRACRQTLAGEERSDRGALHRQRGGGAQPGAHLRYRVRGLPLYADRTLNIEVAYDFRKHGYAERNYISPDPVEWSNLVSLEGGRPIAGVSTSRPSRRMIRRLSSGPRCLQARLQGFLPKPGRLRDLRQQPWLHVVHQRVAKRFRAGRAILAGDLPRT